ncbi:Veg family protein [Proteinivorax tanatarense]|uniref:Veg family protein n=1 Tax=Proteinivorax tanatarense TaxID=1260629 RepID=A0AAU7VLP3_9FIRM
MAKQTPLAKKNLANKNPLTSIRTDLEAYIGQKIMLKANRGRKKAIERTGVLEQTYPSHFLVRIDEENFNRRLSFSYADVLTETVELTLFKPDSEEKIRFSVS